MKLAVPNQNNNNVMTTIKNLTPSPNLIPGKIGSRPGSSDMLGQQIGRPPSVGNFSDSGHSLDPSFGVLGKEFDF